MSKSFTRRHTAAWILAGLFSMPVTSYSDERRIRETPVVNVIRNWAPAVVNIGTEQIVLLRRDPFWGSYGNALDRFFEESFGAPLVSALKLKSVGSGVVIRSEGLILTNAHVVNRASKIFVTFSQASFKPTPPLMWGIQEARFLISKES